MGRFNDLTGKTFGRITVIRRGPSKNGHSRWECKCSCGNPEHFLVDGYSLTSGGTKSCGCYHKEQTSKAGFDDITGQTFGRLTVESFAGHSSKGNLWNCVCSCPKHGRIKVLTTHLRQGIVKSCGCLQDEVRKHRAHDLTGKRFGRLVAIEPTNERVNSNVIWLCKRDCGNESKVAQYKLESGETKSCGCLVVEAAKARRKYMTSDELKLCECYDNMISRCYNSKVDAYPYYGGRGITVCDEWRNSRESFVRWGMANGYSPGLSIDRIDNNGNYSPSNCRFVTMVDQCSNRRSNVNLTIGGVTDTITSWSRKIGCHHTTLKNLYDKDQNLAKSKVVEGLSTYVDSDTISRLLVPGSTQS